MCSIVTGRTKDLGNTSPMFPNCGGKLVYRTSRKGERFIACSNFPKCKYTENINGESTLLFIFFFTIF